MSDYSRSEAAERAGVDIGEVARLVDAGLLAPAEGDRFSVGDVRRIAMVQSFLEAGIPLEGLAEAQRNGRISLAFLDSAAFDRYGTFVGHTFRELSEQTGVPVELLMVMREAMGLALASPEDRVREDEMEIVPLLQAQVEANFHHPVIERALRVIGDGLRRIGDVEADWFRTEVIEPFAPGKTGAEISAMATRNAERFAEVGDPAIMAIYRAQRTRAWTANVVAGLELSLSQAGLYERLERPPAMCFLDISGYTRLTQERGDAAAADLAEQLGRLVHRAAVKHGGRPVKWLGDGVMLYFRDPGPGVLAALEMVDGVVAAGLPPAHVGLHAGPVIFQEGDYYGQTVNVASRIAGYARPGEVVVSQAVVDASEGARVTFSEIGPVELKGVPVAMRLSAAHRDRA